MRWYLQSFLAVREWISRAVVPSPYLEAQAKELSALVTNATPDRARRRPCVCIHRDLRADPCGRSFRAAARDGPLGRDTARHDSAGHAGVVHPPAQLNGTSPQVEYEAHIPCFDYPLVAERASACARACFPRATPRIARPAPTKAGSAMSDASAQNRGSPNGMPKSFGIS